MSHMMASHGKSVGFGICLGMATMRILEIMGVTKTEDQKWQWRPRPQKGTSRKNQTDEIKTPAPTQLNAERYKLSENITNAYNIIDKGVLSRSNKMPDNNKCIEERTDRAVMFADKKPGYLKCIEKTDTTMVFADKKPENPKCIEEETETAMMFAYKKPEKRKCIEEKTDFKTDLALMIADKKPEKHKDIEEKPDPPLSHHVPRTPSIPSIVEPRPKPKPRTKFFIIDRKSNPTYLKELKQKLESDFSSSIDKPGGLGIGYKLSSRTQPSPSESSTSTDLDLDPYPGNYVQHYRETEPEIDRPGGLGFSYKPPSLNLHIKKKELWN